MNVFVCTLPVCFGTLLKQKHVVYSTWYVQVSLFELREALEGKSGSCAVPKQCVDAIDVILRHLPSMRLLCPIQLAYTYLLQPLFRYTPVGRSFFSAPDRYYHSLGGGREVWFGFHQSVKPSQWKMMMNIDGWLSMVKR